MVISTQLRARNERSVQLTDLYLGSNKEPSEVVIRLKSQGTLLGNLLAGEILLDRAAYGERHMASSTLSRARYFFGNVMQKTANKTEVSPARIRAGMRLSQFQLMSSVYGKKKLLGPHSVSDAYNELLTHASASLELYRATYKPGQPFNTAQQHLGEMSVLLLAQRYALKQGVDTRDWLPIQGLFSEANANKCAWLPGNFAWNMNIFTSPKEKAGTPSQTYAIKTELVASSDTSDGITIGISPILELFQDEPFVPEKIIAACNVESNNPAITGRHIEELNNRTELFLNAIDA